MNRPLARAIELLQSADEDLEQQLAAVGDELKRGRIAAVRKTVRAIILELRARPPS